MDSGENINDVNANVCDKEEAAENGDADDDCDADNDNGDADSETDCKIYLEKKPQDGALKFVFYL